MSRIEAFSDSVFAITITLLIITDGTKLVHMGDLVNKEHAIALLALVLTFTLLTLIWNGHYLFFRRFDLRDTYCRILNYIFLFVVLCYAYPLKLMFGFLVRLLWLGNGAFKPDEWQEIAGSGCEFMTIYSTGFGLVYGLLILFYRHAWKYRDELELTQAERFITKNDQQAHYILVGFATLSVLIAQWHWPLSGMIYIVMAIILWFHGWRGSVRLKRLTTPENDSLTPG